MDVRLKRAYEPASAEDGYRVLVDRLWPRGVSKEQAKLDEWDQELAPSSQLREWFGHEPDRFPEFRRRYIDELRANRAAPTGAQTTRENRHAHARLLGPRQRAQRRRRPRRGVAAWAAEVR